MSDFPILFGLRHQWVDLSLTSTTKVNYATGSWPLSGSRATGWPTGRAQGYHLFSSIPFPRPRSRCCRWCEWHGELPLVPWWTDSTNSWLVPLTLPSGSFWGLICPPELFCTTCLRLCLSLVSTGWYNKTGETGWFKPTVISPCSLEGRSSRSRCWRVMSSSVAFGLCRWLLLAHPLMMEREG